MKIRNRGRRIASMVVLAFVVLSLCQMAAFGQDRTSTGPSRQLQQIEPLKVWPSKAKRWALVIGIDQYADPQISPLKGAANDAHALTDALVRYAGFPQDQVILLATDQPLERQPTRLNILRRLSNLASLVPKDGLLLISFAGHGIERTGQAYLIPSDSQITDDVSLLEESAVSVTRMRERIRATGVAQVVILLDACRNDPGGRADASNPLTEAYLKGFSFDVRNREVTAFATLYATAIGQRAYEYTEKKQGYFTWAVVEGLKGGAANDKGEVTLANLIKYVQENVPKRVAIDLGSSKQQRPFSQMEGYKADELVIAVGGASAPIASSAPATPATDPAAFELSYWETIKSSNNPDDFKSYLEKYPDGQFAALARNRIGTFNTPAKPESRSKGDSATELAFWDAIKNSTNAEDFQAYLKKYPQGEFAELAANRLKPLQASLREKEKEDGARRVAEDLASQTKSFRGSFGVKMALASVFFQGTLSVSPVKIQFVCDGDKYCKAGQVQPLDCAMFGTAVADGSTIREIAISSYKYRITTSSASDAASALQAIRSVCSQANPPRMAQPPANDRRKKGVPQ